MQKTGVIQNLKDAGCSEDLIRDFWGRWNEEHPQEGLWLLRKHRDCLLVQLHRVQKQIDCLDYFFYQIENRWRKNQIK